MENIWRKLKTLWEEDKLIFHGTSEKFRNHYAFKELLDAWLWYRVDSLLQKGHFMVLNRSLNISESIPIGLRSVTTGSSVWTKKPSTFSVKDYRNKGQWKELTLSGVRIHPAFF